MQTPPFFFWLEINPSRIMYTYKQNPIYFFCFICFFFIQTIYSQKSAPPFTLKGYAFSAGMIPV